LFVILDTARYTIAEPGSVFVTLPESVPSRGRPESERGGNPNKEITMPDEKQTVIQIKKNGPYVATNVWKLTNSKGESLRTEEVMSLCRCGHSTTKPFCSGAHKEHGFTDEKN